MKKLFTFYRYLQALNLKVYTHKHLPVLFASIFFFTALPFFVDAQTTLPRDTVVTGPAAVDYIIPSNIVVMYVNLNGAQGGNIETSCSNYGGMGAHLIFHLNVGYCSPQSIVPGGTLRLVVGSQGESVRQQSPNNNYGAGGGGGSALLYKAPGSSDWIILAVAGGGGGAGSFESTSGDCYGFNGVDAQNDINGSHGIGTCFGGAGGTNGYGGEAAGINSFGGGGAFGDGTSVGGNPDCTGKAGFPNGSAGGNCSDNTYSGGFGFGSGGVGITGGGGGGGYSGGGGGCSGPYGSGGGSGGSYFNNTYDSYTFFESDNTGNGTITINCNSGNDVFPQAVSLESSTLSDQQVLGCSLANCADFGYSTTETATTLQDFNNAGGEIVSGGCSVNTITYHDSAASGNAVKTVYRTFTVTDVGNNKAIAKQTINITDPGIAATLTPSSQVVCGNVKPATITANVTAQFGITVQWYKGDNAIFSEATIISGATSVSYSPPATSITGITYYFIKMTDGCGAITIKNATVDVGDAVTWYKDFDNDGYYDPLYIGQPTCQSPGPGYKSTGLLGEDCNDNDSTINPQTVWVLDADGDGYYSGSPYTGCLWIGATGYVKKTNQLPGDCNDSDATIHPGAIEVFNGKDDNCDGQIDEGLCGVTANLRATNVTTNSATVKWDSGINGIKYNLSYKADNVSTWTVINNIKKPNYNLTGLSLYYAYDYKVQTVCPYTEKSAYSKVSSFTTSYGGPTYCATKGNTYYEYIDRVVLGSAINNKSGDNGGYGNYFNLNATMSAGGTFQIKLTPGFHFDSAMEYWEVYIDYNQDGFFKVKDGEKVVTGHGSHTLSKNFTVPLTAKNGFTRMRVIMHYDSALNQPCGNFINGEAEDYTVIITGGTAAIIASTGAETSEDAQALTMSSVLVIPNPVNSSSATAVLNMIKGGNATIRITDLSGRTVYKKDITNLYTGKNQVVLTGLAALTNGTYFIEAKQNDIIIGRAQVAVNK